MEESVIGKYIKRFRQPPEEIRRKDDIRQDDFWWLDFKEQNDHKQRIECLKENETLDFKVIQQKNENVRSVDSSRDSIMSNENSDYSDSQSDPDCSSQAELDEYAHNLLEKCNRLLDKYTLSPMNHKAISSCSNDESDVDEKVNSPNLKPSAEVEKMKESVVTSFDVASSQSVFLYLSTDSDSSVQNVEQNAEVELHQVALNDAQSSERKQKYIYSSASVISAGNTVKGNLEGDFNIEGKPVTLEEVSPYLHDEIIRELWQRLVHLKSTSFLKARVS